MLRELVLTRISLAVLGAVISIAPPAVSASWPQFQGNASHSGWNRAETRIGPGNVVSLHLVWQTQARGPVESSVSVVGRTVYFTTAYGDVLAVAVATGHTVWKRHIVGGIGIGSPAPAVSGGRVLVAADRGETNTLFAFQAATGKRLWQSLIGGLGGGEMPAPTVAGATVFIHREALIALDARSGDVRWSEPIDCFVCDPAVAAGLVVSVDANALEARSASTGDLRWRVDAAGTEFFSAALSGGRAFAPAMDLPSSGNRQQSVYAFSLTDGSRIWRADVGLSRYIPDAYAAVAAGRVFYPSPDGSLYALSADDGAEIWSTPIGVTTATPAVANGIVYITAGKEVLAIDATSGTTLWSSAIGDSSSTPTVVNGTLYVGNDAGVVRAFRPRQHG